MDPKNDTVGSICKKCQKPTLANELNAYAGECEDCNMGSVLTIRKPGVATKTRRAKKNSNISQNNH